MRTALVKVLDEARDLGRMTPEHELRALVAERYAAAADKASRGDDTAGMLRAAEKLLEVLDTLPVRSTSGGGSADDGSGGGGSVLELFDGGPTMGDAADG